ncbi:amidohydrolase family protein [Halalkalibacter akibai]|uniref:Cytosine deaminase n=1 Tax=Halalkalibacter akibai (strain ATCC 43226 / DSM 21942 / CIP 109018 / JCM 9157 / 1139) TaxID=1236973 RepID=W4QML2_HALA3|nr:amidohydrolase family protein [Halalkalibacter akibai]GAE33137.1 cytosine deaminase [Halalkalibacter akibai JCM 9157]
MTSGKPTFNQSGELFEGIQLWNQYRKTMSMEDVKERALSVIKIMASQGVLFMRTMVDTSDPKLIALRALLEVKREVSAFMTIQIVGFPQNGLSSVKGVEQLEQAIELGVDGISAVPHLEPTREHGVRSLETCFQLAIKHQCFIHIFCDETDDQASRFLEVVASLALETNLKNQVTVSHINAMSYYDEAYVRKLIGILQASKINVVTAPLVNSAMQGRFDSWPKGRGITRVKDLQKAGIKVAVAHDDFLSPFYPLGTGSLLAAGHLLLHVAHMTGAEDFETVIQMMTRNPAEILGLTHYGIEEEMEANLLIVSAENAHDLLRRQPVAELVIGKGRLIAETPALKTTFHMQAREGV